MSLTVNCFENLSIKSLMCACCKPKDPDTTVKLANANNQIVILATPSIEFPELAVYEDLPITDIIVFSNDEMGHTRFTSVQGQSLLRGILCATSAPELDGKMVSKVKVGEVKKQSVLPEYKYINIKPKHLNDIIGRKLEDVLPDYLSRFLLPIFRQTLQGNYIQIVCLWLGTTLLLRTLPILNFKRAVVGGICILTPYNTDFNGDVNRFAIGSSSPSDDHKIRSLRIHSENKTEESRNSPPGRQSMSEHSSSRRRAQSDTKE